MIINTCSGAISFARELEVKSAQFYRELAWRYAEGKGVFLSFAKGNEENITQVERAYYGVITDALEGCFAFNLDPEAYVIRTELGERVGYPEIIAQALEVEDTMTKFYQDAAEQSKSLMADIPRAFSRVARNRNNRRSRLNSLIGRC